MTPQQDNSIEKKQVVTSDVVGGIVFQTVTVMHKDIDTGDWFPVERMTQSTGKNVEDYKADMEDLKSRVQQQHLETIKQFDDAIAEVDTVVAAEAIDTKQVAE